MSKIIYDSQLTRQLYKIPDIAQKTGKKQINLKTLLFIVFYSLQIQYIPKNKDSHDRNEKNNLSG
jgi:hypothetical protein